MIPKILMQTSKYDFPEEYINHIKENLPKDWTHFTFNDEQAISYFQNNPIEMFPKIIDVYNSFSKGAHKADLFRYYFMYLNGGVYADTDIRFYNKLDFFINKSNNKEFYCFDDCYRKLSCFQGFFACTKKSPIILKSLILAYYTEPKVLDENYFKFTDDLFEILKKKKIFIFRNWKFSTNFKYAKLTDKNKIILEHHYRNVFATEDIIKENKN